MNFFGWNLTMPEHWRRSRRPPVGLAPGKMRCSKCESGIHKHERFRITAVEHINCEDPKGIGALMLPLGLEGKPNGHDSNLRFVGLNQEPVIVPVLDELLADVMRARADVLRERIDKHFRNIKQEISHE